MDFLNNNTTQLLNSTIVNPANVPIFNRTDQNVPSGSSDSQSPPRFFRFAEKNKEKKFGKSNINKYSLKARTEKENTMSNYLDNFKNRE